MAMRILFILLLTALVVSNGSATADAPLLPSVRSSSYGHVNQLRDPCIFEENGKIYLLYAVAGESGIAIAEIDPDSL